VSPVEVGLVVLIALVIAGPRHLSALARRAADGVRRLRRRAAGDGALPAATAGPDLDRDGGH
jgi:Sec-independent protein translocase protein TatA